MDDNKNKLIEDLGSVTENNFHESDENISSDFSSSDSDSSDSNEYNDWEARIFQRNGQLDDILIKLLIGMANGDGSIIQRPMRRDTAKGKRKRKGNRKGNASDEIGNEIVAELRELRLAMESDIEIMKKRLELDQQKEERNLTKMQRLHLNTLLQKKLLSPQEENIKRYLMSKFHKN